MRNRLLRAAAMLALALGAWSPDRGRLPARPRRPRGTHPERHRRRRRRNSTNLAHLDWLLDDVPLLPGVAGHTTYRQDAEPTARAPWVYADRQADGSFKHVGGGPVTDAAKRLVRPGRVRRRRHLARRRRLPARLEAERHASSQTTAYELLRSLTYLQTSDGPNAGNVVLWQQSDGTLNPTAIPKELPGPADSAESFWLARTVWALGEGYAGFALRRPAPSPRSSSSGMDLALGALDRQSLAKYG